MEAYINTDKKSVLLEVTLKSDKMRNGTLIVHDPYFVNTQYTNRDMYVDGEKTFYVRMPISPKVVKVVSTFDIVKIEKKKLPKKFSVSDVQNYNMRTFMVFAQNFCEKAGYLKSGYEYWSDNEIFCIKYLPTLTNENGAESSTPARINKHTGVIEISAKKFRAMTIPMRVALLLHEYCHFWKNKNPASELESDRNSLFMYLGLGYPRYESYVAWLETFDKTPNNGEPHEAHKERLEQIKKIIDEFDKKFLSISFIK